MRLAILCHGLRTAGGESVGRNILSCLNKIRPYYKYMVVVPDQEGYLDIDYPPDTEILKYAHGSVLNRILFDKIDLPKKISTFNPDIVWGLGNMGLTKPNAKQAILLHKAQMVYSASHRPDESLSRRIINKFIWYQLKSSLASTQLVFCQTKVMRERFKKSFGYKGITEIMPNAVSSLIHDNKEEIISSKINNIIRPVKLLVLTRYYAHKNIELIVECFDRYRDELSGVACVLTIAEDQHPRAKKLLTDIHDRGLDDVLVNIGPQPQDRLASLYHSTDALLLPTLLESFSGTYLEAMAFRKPILTSDLDFAKEICGDAALYFNPWDAKSLKNAILKIVNQPEVFSNLIDMGSVRRKELECDWDDIVTTSLNSIEKLIAS